MPMMSTDFARPWVAAACGGREYILPTPFAIRLRIFARQCVRQVDGPETLTEIAGADPEFVQDVFAAGRPALALVE